VTIGLAVLGYVILIRLGSLGPPWFEIWQESQEATETNLKGRSTGNEFVADGRLVLGTGLILSTVSINVRTTHVVTGDAYVVVGLRIFALVVEETHDYDVLLACGGQVESRRCFGSEY
jgi:hypothetical protein